MSIKHPNPEFNESWGPMLSQILGYGRVSGADFIEIFMEKRVKNSVLLESNDISAITPSFFHGAGIRVIKNKSSSYVTTGDLSFEGLKVSLEKGLNILGLSLKKNWGPIAEVCLEPFRNYSARGEKALWKGQLPLLENVCPILKKTQSCLLPQIPSLQALETQFVIDFQDVMVASSDGIFAKDLRLYQFFRSTAICVEGVHRSVANVRKASNGEMDMVFRLDCQEIAQEMTDTTGPMLKAKYIEAGDYPIVMANGFGGVIFHEACGHLLETTQMMAKATPFLDSKDKPIASPQLTAWDCAYPKDTHFGSIEMDDEGMPTQNTLLIENGVLRNFLSDRMGSHLCTVPRTGSARRQDYTFAPTSRMRNTFIAPGPHTPQNLIESLDNGLYCKRMGGGSVGPTGEFNFTVEEAYLVKGGQIKEPVKGAILVGTAEKTLRNISMCANDVSLSPGFCGSSSGTVYVTVGQPHIRVENMTVGGR